MRQHNVSTPLPVLWWRSVGNTHSAFVLETAIDELAHLAGKDPVAFRLGLLAKDERDTAVIRLAAAKAGWGRKLPKGKGLGVAFHHSFGSRVAMIADVSAERDTIKVERVVAAVDVGIAINPDIVTAQVEGTIGFAL